MMVVFRVVSTEKGPCSFAIRPMDIPGFAEGFILAKNHHSRFEKACPERCRLACKASYQPFMILAQHGRNPIPFSRKLKKLEEVVLSIQCLGTGQCHIDI